MQALNMAEVVGVEAKWVDQDDERRLHVTVRTGEGHTNFLLIWHERCLETHAVNYGCEATLEVAAAAWLRHNLEELPGSFKVRVVDGKGKNFKSEVGDFYAGRAASRSLGAPTLTVTVPPAPKKVGSKVKADEWTELLKWIRDTGETK